MENRQRNITAIGLLVLLGGLAFLLGFYYLLGQPVLQRTLSVVALVPDGAGLKRGDRVHLHGVDVGLVREVRLKAPNRVSVVLRLDSGVRLPADTRASIMGDVFGAHSVRLSPGEAMVHLEDGDTIRGEAVPQMSELVAGLGDQAQGLLTRADSLLSPAAVANVHATAAVLPASAQELRAAFAELHRAAASLRRSAEQVEETGAGPALSATLQELQGSARAFTAAAQSMERSMGSLASVLDKIDTGQGTLGRLLNDSTLYLDVHGAVADVRGLTAEIRENPRRYINLSVF